MQGSWEMCLGPITDTQLVGTGLHFFGLTFDCWLKMQNEDIQPPAWETTKSKNKHKTPGSNWNMHMFIALTPFISLWSCVCVKALRHKLSIAQTVMYTSQPWLCIYTLWISCAEVWDGTEENVPELTTAITDILTFRHNMWNKINLPYLSTRRTGWVISALPGELSAGQWRTVRERVGEACFNNSFGSIANLSHRISEDMLDIDPRD